MPVPSEDLVDAPGVGRSFRSTRRVRLGDVGPLGRVRLDAIARYLQDVANDDSTEAGLEEPLAWLVRRTTIEVGPAPVFNEQLDLSSFCSGLGARWAERRTSLRGSAQGRVEAVALWVSLDGQTGRPRRLSDQFRSIYGESAADRRVRARLIHPDAEASGRAGITRAAWPLRSVDLDLLGHVNNAAYWTVLEDVLAQRADARPETFRAEVEYRSPILDGDEVEVLSAVGEAGIDLWLVVAEELRATIRYRQLD